MRNVTVARRYARAIYQLAQESKDVENVLQAMNHISMAVKSSPPLAKILLNPLIIYRALRYWRHLESPAHG